jgi:hypothetical protein
MGWEGAHALFSWERRDGAGGEFLDEVIVQVHKISEPSSHFGESALEGR